jgi:hypothetical protein
MILKNIPGTPLIAVVFDPGRIGLNCDSPLVGNTSLCTVMDTARYPDLPQESAAGCIPEVFRSIFTYWISGYNALNL